MHAFVTGAAGFIGSHLVERLLERGDRVVGFDNLSTGTLEFLSSAMKHAKFRFVEADVLDLKTLITAMEGVDLVFHFAANADIRGGGSTATPGP